ncbi:MAG: DUF1858 domain-containing protein [Nanobdellota archaeon]
MEIKKDMNIMEIIRNNPDTAQVFMDAGIGCIGCAASNFETLEEGLKAHGKSDEDIDEFVKKLNDAAQEKEE